MEKLTKYTMTVVILLLSVFVLLQVIGLQGKQSLGWSQKFIDTYSLIGSISILLLVTFGILAEAVKAGDHPILDIVSIFDFDKGQDFRLLKGKLGLIVGMAFILLIGFTAATGLVNWQPIPSPINLDETIRSPLAEGHENAVAQYGISNEEESYFISAPPSLFEDLTLNYFLPLIVTALMYVPLYFFFNIEPEVENFLIISTIAALITSGIVPMYYGIESGFFPTFSGAHSDVYTNLPSFYAAAGYSFMSSWINMQVGYPISIPAHFLNNYFVTVGMLITLSIAAFSIKFPFIKFIISKLKEEKTWKQNL